MAIEIVKEGCKKFNITCPNCGCEFTYEYEDVGIGVVPCPCCQAHLPHKGVIGTVNTNPSPMPIWYGQQVAPDGYKIRGGLNKATDKCDDLVYRPFTFPDWAKKSDNWSGCEGCPNNPKYLKAPYIGDSPCQWCQKNPNKITCTSGGSNV